MKCWGRNEDGTIFKSELGNLVDINENKADYSLFDERRFFRPMGGRIFKTLPFETYRGCPYKCTYCNSPMQLKIAKDNNQGKFLRRKSMDSIKERLECEFKLYEPEFIYFVDDSFLARPEEEIYDFCDMYEQFKNNYPDFALLFGYNHSKEIFAKEKDFIDQGGKWIVYVPEIKVIE